LPCPEFLRVFELYHTDLKGVVFLAANMRKSEHRISESDERLDFEIRASFGFRHSDFGFACGYAAQ
jgi:hypothetical protein